MKSWEMAEELIGKTVKGKLLSGEVHTGKVVGVDSRPIHMMRPGVFLVLMKESKITSGYKDRVFIDFEKEDVQVIQ